VAGVAILVAGVVAGCGSSSSSTTSNSTPTATTAAGSVPTVLVMSLSESGTGSQFSGPTVVKGGLVTLRLTNDGKAPHNAQLLRLLGSHTIPDALAVLGSESGKVPSWLRAEGGVAVVPPGATSSATMVLPAGNYGVVDAVGARERHGVPAVTPLTVSSGEGGALPTTGTTVTAAAPGKDRYKWELSGPLKVGADEVTFVSKGRSALHQISAVRVTASKTTAQLVKVLMSNGPPPSYVDSSTQTQTAVLDGNKSQTTQLVFSKPGIYLLFCHLGDRNGGKPHFAEGLITTVNVK
jgi:plastocyanin